jgi:hypothetical protein
MTSAIVMALEASVRHKTNDNAPERPESMSRQLLEEAPKPSTNAEEHQANRDRVAVTDSSLQEPSLAQPKIGNPISHGQIRALWKQTKELGITTCNLETLLRGARVYVPPTIPKPEPVSLLLPHSFTLLTAILDCRVQGSDGTITT